MKVVVKFFLLIGFYFLPFILFGQLSYNDIIQSISDEDIERIIDTLASETMEGRMTGERGQKLAAEFIANYFLKNKLESFFPDKENPYYQEFKLKNYRIGKSAFYYSDFQYEAPVFFASQAMNDSISDTLYFAGYGNNVGDNNNLYNNKSIFFFANGVKNAIKKSKKIAATNNINFFIVGIPFGKKINETLFDEEINDIHNFFDLYYFYHYVATDYRSGKDFKAFSSRNKLIPDFTIKSDKDMKIIFVPEEVCSQLFYHEQKSVKEFKKMSEKTTNIQASAFSFKTNYNPVIDSISTENVLGFYDCQHSDETIIIGAHYDHVGRNADHSINYGADDNASGISLLLILSDIFTKLAEQNALTKDIVLIAYTAEEMGLLGSEYFADYPLLPLSNINVVINVDMIGRDKDDDPENSNRLFILEWKGGKKYLKNIHKINKKYTHLILDNNPGDEHKNLWTYGSDHYSFLEKDISCITFFTGLHSDYHTPNDTPDKINYDKLNRIIQLIILNTIEISTEIDK